MSTEVASQRLGSRRLPPAAARGWPAAVLALAMLAAAATILYLTRGFTFYYDEWNFVVNRQAFTGHALFAPHNEHMVLVPVLLFKALWAVAGLGEYWTFRVLVVALHLVCGGLVYVTARRRVGRVLALAPAILLLFLGTAWEVILWPFEIQFLIPVAAGLGALLAVERGDLRGDLAASGLLALALASGSIGVPMTAGVGTLILFGRDRIVRLLRVVAAPIAMYAVWLHVYDPFRHQYGSIGSVPKFAFEQLAAVVAGIAGFHYHSVRAVALVAAGLLVVAIAVRLVRDRRGGSRLAALVVMMLVYWGALALYRPWVANQQPSRYLYAGAAFVLLAGVELVRGRRPGPGAMAAVVLIVALCVASNIGDLRDGAHQLRVYSQFVEPGLGALDLTRGRVDPAFRPEPTRAPDIVAGKYFEAVDRFGSPADPPSRILERPEVAREAADIVMVEALRLGLRPSGPPRATGTAPLEPTAQLGSVRTRRGCVEFKPRGRPGLLEIQLPRGGVAIHAAPGSPVLVSLRRFAGGYVPNGVAPAENLFAGREAFGRVLLRARVMPLAGGRSGVLRIPTDAAETPWRAQIAAVQRTLVCGLPAAG